jgi:tetratricopeptide (TPR) repeat protein
MKRGIFLVVFVVYFVSMGCTDRAKESESKLRMCRSLVAKERFAEAVPILSEVIANRDSLPSAFSLRGTCYTFLDQIDSAILDFRHVLNQPDATCAQRINALNDLTNIYEARHARDTTSKFVREMIHQRRNCPSHFFSLPRLYDQLATIMTNLGEFQEAQKLLDTALILGIDTFSFASNRAYLSSEMDKPDSAIFWLSVGLETRDTAKNAYINWAYHYYERGDLFYKIGKPTAACKDWQSALTLGYAGAQAKLDSFCTK